ncbi:hypothetical protein [Escherichia coli]|uniref:hypothetical protein n=1 Tax=Escherichia coli TaxID=562 RepID=UPI0032E7F6D8
MIRSLQYVDDVFLEESLELKGEYIKNIKLTFLLWVMIGKESLICLKVMRGYLFTKDGRHFYYKTYYGD